MKKAHEQVTTGSSGSSGFPRAMVLSVSYALSPVSRAFLPPSQATMQKHRRPAWRQRRGVRTTRLRRTRRVVRLSTQSASTASRPAFVTIASRPSRWDGTGESIKLFLPNGEAKYFLKEGWTTA